MSKYLMHFLSSSLHEMNNIELVGWMSHRTLQTHMCVQFYVLDEREIEV